MRRRDGVATAGDRVGPPPSPASVRSDASQAREHAAAPPAVRGLLRGLTFHLPVLAVGVVALVIGLSDQTMLPSLVLAGIWSIAALGLSMILGWTGLIAAGQGAIVGIAAYATAYGSATLGWSAPACVVLALAVTFVVALLLSPILRIRGFYFALVTLAICLIVERVLVGWQGVTGGANGLPNIGTLSVGGYEFVSPTSYLLLAWGISVVGALAYQRLISGRIGRALRAIRDDPGLAASFGVPTAKLRIRIWLISSVYSALAGIVFAYYSAFVSPDQFNLDISVTLLAAVVIGGSASPAGALAGSLVLFAGPELLGISSDQILLFTALLLIAVPVAVRSEYLTRLRAWAVSRFAGRATLDSLETAAADGAGLDDDLVEVGAAGLTLTGVRKAFGGLEVLRGLDLDVEAGSIQGLIGPNGAGKTTLINLITGALPVDAGEVAFDGEDVTRWGEDARARFGLTRSFQQTRLVPGESVLTNVLMGTYTGGRSGLWGALVGGRRVRHEEQLLLGRACSVLRQLNSSELATERAGSLTAGQQRLVATARAVAARPKLLILDEPAAGLNETEAAQLAETLLEIRSLGVTVLLIEHHLDLVSRVCDRVAVLFEGRILINDRATNVMTDPRVVEAYLGTGFGKD